MRLIGMWTTCACSALMRLCSPAGCQSTSESALPVRALAMLCHSPYRDCFLHVLFVQWPLTSVPVQLPCQHGQGTACCNHLLVCLSILSSCLWVSNTSSMHHRGRDYGHGFSTPGHRCDLPSAGQTQMHGNSWCLMPVFDVRRIARQQITRIGHLAQLRGGNIARTTLYETAAVHVSFLEPQSVPASAECCHCDNLTLGVHSASHALPFCGGSERPLEGQRLLGENVLAEQRRDPCLTGFNHAVRRPMALCTHQMTWRATSTSLCFQTQRSSDTHCPRQDSAWRKYLPSSQAQCAALRLDSA